VSAIAKTRAATELRIQQLWDEMCWDDPVRDSDTLAQIVALQAVIEHMDRTNGRERPA
jgi:hypothetical protein